MLAELLSTNVLAVLVIFARVGAALLVLPGFSSTYVSPRYRLLLGLAVSVLLAPVLAGVLPAMPQTVPGLAALLGAEITLGLALGMMARILFAALHAAGTFISFYVSLTNGFVLDPITEQQSSTVAGFLGTFGMVLLFVTDLHHLLLAALADSYDLFPAGGGFAIGDWLQVLVVKLGDSFALAFKMSAPVLLVGFVYNLGAAILGRIMPQLPVFFFGLPVQISAQLWAMMLTLSAVMLLFLEEFAAGVGVLGTTLAR